MKNQPSSILPGRMTYVQDFEKSGVKPIYEVDPKIGEMSQLIEKIEAISTQLREELFAGIDQEDLRRCQQVHARILGNLERR